MKKIPVWKNIVLILSLLVTIIIATLAWFYTDPHGSVGVDVNVGEASYVQISSDQGKNWSDDLEVDIGVNKIFKEISGDGKTFFAPVYDIVENSEGVLVSSIVAFEQVEENTKYYEQTFSFKSDTNQKIYLAPESFVNAASAQGTNFINGAIRVAFFELDKDGKETLKCIWAPNSSVEYYDETNTFTRKGNVEERYYYQTSVKPVDVSTLSKSDSNVTVIPTGESSGSGHCSGCGYHANSKYMWSCGEGLPQNAPSLLMIDVPEGEKFGYKEMKIRVWLEGHDRECVSLVSNQKFTMKFQFDARKGE